MKITHINVASRAKLIRFICTEVRLQELFSLPDGKLKRGVTCDTDFLFRCDTASLQALAKVLVQEACDLSPGSLNRILGVGGVLRSCGLSIEEGDFLPLSTFNLVWHILTNSVIEFDAEDVKEGS